MTVSPSRRPLAVFLLLFGVYLGTASLRVETIDTGVRLEVAKSLVRDGSPAVEPMRMPTPFGIVGSFPGADGRHYSVYGLGQSLLMVPLVAIAGDRAAPLVPLINALATALTGALLILIGRRLRFSDAAATGTALLFGLGTLAWPHAKFTFEAPLEMAAATIAVWLLLGGGTRRDVLAGAAFGFALLVRPSAFLMGPALAWFLLTRTEDDRRSRARGLVAFAAGAAPMVIVALLYNEVRWGSPFATGYVQTEHRYLAMQWEGFVGLLASPGRGFFWYSPILLLALAGLIDLWREQRRIAAAVLIFAGAYLAFLSFLTVWNGDWTWGPRHLLPVVPILAIGLLPRLEPGRTRRIVLVPLAILSVLVQLPGVTMNYEVYYLWHNQWMRETGERQRAGQYHLHAPHSQLYVQARQAWIYFRDLKPRMESYRPERDGDPYASPLGGTAAVTKRVPDLWWIYFPLTGVPAAGTIGLGAVSAGLIGVGAWRLRR